jgi:hypothetical protein
MFRNDFGDIMIGRFIVFNMKDSCWDRPKFRQDFRVGRYVGTCVLKLFGYTVMRTLGGNDHKDDNIDIKKVTKEVTKRTIDRQQIWDDICNAITDYDEEVYDFDGIVDAITDYVVEQIQKAR